ncbi:CRISPR-associated protein Csm2 [Ectothiorhodospira magna]|uniref:CRISPR system Cms protein Csm2 n=1 Tax=Ectothiorhodospira magna TaxID=867345 RepID=A0A1H9GCF5_9GAMM|nr:type III-A CRISPR-associated protein Csm2 [Ectothiorhodospira magna]SEQ47801.1 CRISPR-associated protein Csm2 [Ectothiorhodospira magna]
MMPQGNHRGRPGRPGTDRPHHRDQSTLNTTRIVLNATPLSVELFDDVARQTAREVAGDSRKNKPSQIRQFYDELVMWEEKVRRDESRFEEYLPFIRMLNAKAAYAQGRNHVDANFVMLIHHCLSQVNTPQTLRNCKLFFEAFMGFYKLERPSD